MKLKERFSLLITDSIIKQMVSVFTVILFLFIIIIIWKWHSLPPQIPFFYSLPRGIEQLGSPFQLILLPFFSFIFFALDFIIATFFYPEERLASKLLIAAGLIITFLLFVTFAKIIFLVT